jgi:hypothetical protein
MVREFIYGVFDKTGKCGSYTGMFKSIEDAKKELKSQMNYETQELGTQNLVLKDDRVVKMVNGVENIMYVIHSFVLR